MAGFRLGNDGGNGGLGAGAGGGGHGDKGRQLMHDLEETAHFCDGLMGTHHQGRSGLGRVHGGTAADGQKAVAALGQVQVPDSENGGSRRIGLHLGKVDTGNAGALDIFKYGGGQLTAHMAAGDHHDLADLVGLQQLRDAAGAARAGNGDGLAPIQETAADVHQELKASIPCFFQTVHR